MKLHKIILYLTCLLLFVLPWQTRFMFHKAALNDAPWEYGSQSVYATELLLGVILTLVIITFVRNKPLHSVIFTKNYFTQRKKVLFSCLAVFLFFGLQAALSQSPEISFNWVLWLIEAGSLALIIFSLSSRAPSERSLSNSPSDGTEISPPPKRGRNDIKLVASFWAGGVVQGLFALFQFFNQQIDANRWLGLAYHSGKQVGDFALEFGDERWLRAYGSFGSPNILGGFLAVCWLFGLILYINYCRGMIYHAPTPMTGSVDAGRGERPFAPTTWRWWPIIITFGQLIIFSGLIVSFSRSAWLGALVGVITVVITVGARYILPLQRTSSADGVGARHALPQQPDGRVGAENFLPLQSQWQPIAKQLFFSLAIAILFFIALKPLFFARAFSEGRLEQKSISERVSQYGQSLHIIENNALWGVGPGTYTLTLYHQNPKLRAWSYQPVHNVYLLALAEMGFVGFGLLILIYYYIVIFLWNQRALEISIVISILIISLFDHYWWSLYSGIILFGAIIGLLVLSLQNKNTQPKLDVF